MTKDNPMTTNSSFEQLKLRINELDAEIERLESNIKDMKSERKDIKGRIFHIINSQNISSHALSPINPINERK